MAHKSTPHVTCKKCKGTGKVRLDGVLLETLQAVRKAPGSTPEALWKALGCKDAIGVTALNGRLAALTEMGLVSRKPAGRFNVYSAVKTPLHD